MRTLWLVMVAILCFTPLYAQSGAAIYKRVVGKYPYAKPFVFGFATPVLAWFLPETEWKRMSSEERATIVAYMPTLVARARNNPDPYLDMPSTAPLYQTAVAKVRSFTDDQWEIGVGQPTRSSAGRTLTLDTQVVCGGNASPDCSGESASEILARARH
jgi:hypothetical protein